LTTELVKFGRYVLVEKIGEGASARVYKAVRSGPMGFRKEVAIKQLRPHVAKGRKAVKALINEARLGGFLRHPNIVEIHEFDRVDETFYISMEFVQGHSLEQILQRVPNQGPIPPRIVAQIAIQICRGLDHAHSATGDHGRPMNLVHRDIKPANFMLTPQGVVKIMDFGIARADTNLFLTQVPGLTKGTPAYMSPEQTVGDKDDPLDNRSDLFSLASVIAEMLTGEVAFKADKLYEILHRIARADTAEALAQVEERAPEMVPALRRAFAKDPEDRYPSAAEMCRDLEAVLETLPGDEELAPWLERWTAPPMPPGSISSTTAGNLASLDEALAMAKGSEIDLGIPVDVVDVSGETGAPPTEARRSGGMRFVLIAGLLAIPVLLVVLGVVGLGLGSVLWSDGSGGEGSQPEVSTEPGQPDPGDTGGAEAAVPANVEVGDDAAAGEVAGGEDAVDAPVIPAIVFSSSPRGAEVYLDGRRLGRTSHCVRGTPGAALVLGLDQGTDEHFNEHVVDSKALNDFEGTDLARHLERIRGEAAGEPLRVGVIGVWTEAKVSFLLYDLKTRAHVHELATCSALTASASRAQHFNALDQLRKVLGVQVFDSVGEFGDWLLPDGEASTLSRDHGAYAPALTIDEGDGEASPEDRDLLSFLYRDSSAVELDTLVGGYSGALVYQASSVDALGHAQAPSVAKLGPRELIAHERVAFERVEPILGNNAPAIRGYVDLGDRAGIKYSYAAMGRGDIRTFQSLYQRGLEPWRVDEILREVFGEILGPFHAAAHFERLPLLDYYTFSPDQAPRAAVNVERVYGPGGDAPTLRLPDGEPIRNVVDFYREYLPRHLGDAGEYHYVSYVHGDLNGANILVDARDNLWIIDFFHTARGHVLQDLLKLENDLLYIYTPVREEADLLQALRISRALVDVEDLRATLPEELPGLEGPDFRRAWATLRTLRSIGGPLVRHDRNPIQSLIGMLRYAMHTLVFEESSDLQKRWALTTACLAAERVRSQEERNRDLRVAWLDSGTLGVSGRLGMTLCPGRRDHGRDLDADLDTLDEAGVDRLVGLLTVHELEWAGVAHIEDACAERGITYIQLPIPDQGVPSVREAVALTTYIAEWLEQGSTIVVHCVGGLGRTGTLAACLAVRRGMTADDAIAAVRKGRGPRAIESPAQVRFVHEFAGAV